MSPKWRICFRVFVSWGRLYQNATKMEICFQSFLTTTAVVTSSRWQRIGWNRRKTNRKFLSKMTRRSVTLFYERSSLFLRENITYMILVLKHCQILFMLYANDNHLVSYSQRQINLYLVTSQRSFNKAAKRWYGYYYFGITLVLISFFI